MLRRADIEELDPRLDGFIEALAAALLADYERQIAAESAKVPTPAEEESK